MKNRRIIAAIAVYALITTTFVIVQSCQKRTDMQKSVITDLEEESKLVVEHIQNFEKKMEMYRNNPDLKSSEKEYVLDAILNWESTLNYNYCYSYLDISEIKIYDTIIAIPKDINDSMAMTDVSGKYYNGLLVAVQTHYFVNAPFTNKKLMAVDLEPTANYDSVRISTWIGNDTPGMLHPEYDWIFGMTEGTCYNHYYIGESDAAKQAAINTRIAFYEAPPAGKRWAFPNPTNFEAKPLDMVGGEYIYINPDDDDGLNNNMDYMIYYAHQNVPPGLTAGVRCVEASPELNFYKQSYVNLTQGWLTGNLKFKECKYTGEDNTYYLRHILKTTIGLRFVSEVAVEELPAIED